MKLAAIDIGTNSMRLLMTEYVDGQFFDRQKRINTTRIGQDVDSNGMISSKSLEKNAKALKEFVDIAKENGCKDVYIMGTSALRDAKNSDDFLQLVKRWANVNVDIVSGNQEANLGFEGVLSGINKGYEKTLVIDIGGGSTEFIVGDQEGIIFSKSENVGALRMNERFIKADPPTSEEIDEIYSYVTRTIKDTIDMIKTFDIKKIIGIGGTITSVAAMYHNLAEYSMEKVHNTVISTDEVEKILNDIKHMTIQERKSLNGLMPNRADIIVPGIVILVIILKELNSKQIIVSEYDNLEGLICQKSKIMS